MGKVSLLLVAGFGIAGATVFFTSKGADVQASAAQGEYEADVIAREIARSAYNAGVADVNRHGTDVRGALAAFGEMIDSRGLPEEEQCANGERFCARRTGQMLDGTYKVEASHLGGNAVEVYAEGTFGYQAGERAVSKTHRINESYSAGVLQVKPDLGAGQCGKLKIEFVDSMAGYCSTILLQKTVGGQTHAPEMVYGPGNKRNGQANAGFETFLDPGTQMNFAIGVENTRNKGWQCDGTTSRGALPTNLRPARIKALGSPELPTYDPDLLAGYLKAYTYSPDHYDWVHWALDSSALLDGDPQEAPWAMVEVDPNNAQRWRIAFEDQPRWNLGPDHPDYHDPNKSLWATKRYGYDTNGDGRGDGWKDNQRFTLVPNAATGASTVSYVTGKDGFHDLRDTGSPADFSDQVIVVEAVSAPCPPPVASAPSGGMINGG